MNSFRIIENEAPSPPKKGRRVIEEEEEEESNEEVNVLNEEFLEEGAENT